MKNQRTATCETILSVLSARGVNYELNGSVSIKELLNADDKKQIRDIVKSGFLNGEIEMSDDAKKKYFGDDTAMNSYVNGLVNNWIKKAPEFNGGEKYAPKNPGSRAGQGDEQIRAMRQLKKTTTDEIILAEIDKAIEARLAEIKPESVVEINVDALPEHLRHLVK